MDANFWPVFERRSKDVFANPGLENISTCKMLIKLLKNVRLDSWRAALSINSKFSLD